MNKVFIGLCVLVSLVSCGPSKAEIEMLEIERQARVDSAIRQDSLTDAQLNQIQVEQATDYYIASDFNLIPGIIVGWAPDEEVIQTWICSVRDGTIYVHIQDSNGGGAIKAIECDYKTWVNLHNSTVNILK